MSAYTLLLYSDRATVRDQMRSAIGDRPVEDAAVEYLEASSYDEAVRLIDTFEIDLVLLDGEARPAGGMGVARQLQDEFEQPPRTCLVLARSADRWLAAWSGADATLSFPLDPLRTGAAVVDVLRRRSDTAAPAA